MNKTILSEMPVEAEKGRVSLPALLEGFFAPRTVAVIGASNHPGNLGRRTMESIAAQGFPGKVIAVHPKGEPIPPFSAVRSVADLPDGTDLVIAAVPARHVPSLVEPLAGKGVRHLIVISGGFSESGEEGRKLQEKLKREAERFGMRVIGPNGMGVFSASHRFNSFFLSPGQITLPPPGPVSIISQSGSILSLMLDRFAGLGIGVSRAVNFGNRVDVGECELLEAFAEDPGIQVIGLYLERVEDGSRFVEIARKVGREKPIVIWKGGHASKGNHAAFAHSASLAGSYEVFQAACAKAGMIEVQGFEEFTDALRTLSLQAPAKGRRTLIVSNGGGMGVFLTDLCEKAGLALPVPSQSAQDSLRKFLPGYYSLRNPIDLTGMGTNEQCVVAVEELLATGEFDCLLMVLLPGTEGITPAIGSLFHNRLPKNLPVVVGTYGPEMACGMRVEFMKDRIPVFDSAEATVKAMEILVQRGRSLREVHIPRLERTKGYQADQIRGWIGGTHSPDEMEIKDLLQRCGVQVPPHRHLKTLGDLAAASWELNFPMVLKAVAPDIKHKTEIRALKLHINNREDLFREWKVLSTTWPGAVWVEEEMPPGLDLMAGAHRDPQFGPVLVFGTGGQYVEVLRDIQRLLLPATDDELFNLVFSTRAGKIIQGVRGETERDIQGLIDFLKLVSDWMTGEPEIESMDFNPVRLYQKGLGVLDAKITLRNPVERREVYEHALY